MGFTVVAREAEAGGRSGKVVALADAAGTTRAEVWQLAGNNCLRWQVRNPDGTWGDLFYVAPDWDANPVPTRSGHPVLFPFPNRLRDGRFTFEGRTYQLPLTESSGQNAIHGFTPRSPWEFGGCGQAADWACAAAVFRPADAHPPAAGLWPGDFALGVNYVLSVHALRVEAVVENRGTTPLPFGLGYHPYFCLPTAPGASADDLVLHTTAESLWESDGGFPTGRKLPVAGELDFRTPRPVGPTVLDHLFGDLARPAADGDLAPVASLGHRSAPGRVTISCSPGFRELQLFTPPHRKAVAIEPYTCATDAANLAARGVDAGWQVLPPGGSAALAVEYRWDPAGVPVP